MSGFKFKKKLPKVRGYVDSSWRMFGYGGPLDAALSNGDFLSEDSSIWAQRDFDREEEREEFITRLQATMIKILSENEQKVITSCVDGMSYGEIAQELKTDSKTVKRILKLARKKIEISLEN